MRPAPEGAAAFPLLSPQSLGRSVERQQSLRLAIRDTNASFRCVVTVDAQEVVVIGLTALGARAFTLSYDGSRIDSQTTIADERAPDPRQILTDLQLAYWPLAQLQAATAGTAWEVSEPQEGLRRVLHAGRLHAEVHYQDAAPWNGRLWLVNFPLGYSLDIESRPLGG